MSRLLSYPSYNIRVRTPDGTIFVLIIEEDEKPFKITINAGKCGQPLAAWAEATANLIEALWKIGVGTDTIVNVLTTQYTPKWSLNEGGIRIRSGPQGVQWALMQYIQMKSEESLVAR